MKPAWAGGPKNGATALPPGLAKKADKLPDGNPWKELAAKLEAEQAEEQNEQEQVAAMMSEGIDLNA